MSAHRLARRPRGLRGKVRGGIAVGCTGCGWMTVGGSMRELIRAHAAHAATAGTPLLQPTPTLDELQQRIADLRARVEAVT